MRKENFKKIIHEFHPYKNHPLTPEDVSYGSGKKIWWQCSEYPEHEWQASPNNRSNKRGCPFCSGQKVSEENNLYLHPISKEFHPTKNRDLKPEAFTLNSGRKVWWQCSKNSEHEWESKISNRIVNKTGCPYCYGRFSSEENNLLLNEASKEFHYERNAPLTPKNFTLGSEKKIWWICNKGHEWEARVADRTYKKKSTGCPVCSCNGSSLIEQELFIFSKHLSHTASNRIKPFKAFEADIWLPDLNLAIEFNGLYWHSLHIKDEDYHYKKWKHFRENGAISLFLWENESLDSMKLKISNAVAGNFQKPINGVYNCELPIPIEVTGNHIPSKIEYKNGFPICKSGYLIM